MAEVVAGSLLRFVSDQLASKALSEFALLTGTDKELKKLGRTLSAIQDVLEDAETMQVKERALGSWLRKLKDLAYDADDVLDDFAVKSTKLKAGAGAGADMKEKVRSFLALPKSLAFRRKIALQVKEINERLDEITEERSKFHLKEGAVGSSSVREETGSYINESEVYGRKEEKEKIVELLKTGSIHSQDISVIAIVGLGGLGKTTLAQVVYNDERVCKHFESRIWVSVSEDFGLRRLVGLILESVTGGEVFPMSIDVMQASLTENLKKKRFLLVLDDVWSESHEKWDRLRALLAVGAKGSKVLVTTRSERVAGIMGGAAPPHRLAALSSEDCRLLFERRAFGDGAERNPNLVEIGREIVKKCGGVPLAAKALGSLLRFKRHESGWLAVKNSELWALSGDEILPALKLSYDHLSSCLKQCFAYCSIFPKDYKISSGTLVRLWQAEGFLRSSDRQLSSELLGLQYVDELLERSLFQMSNNGGGGAETREVITMHDLVHDLARSVSGTECSIVDSSSGRNLAQNLRYASFICNKEPLSAALQSLHGAKKLRTFYLNSPAKETREEERRVDEVLRVISSTTVLLRALHLSRYPVKALPESFKKLKHLRYLDLSRTPLGSFPESIGSLQNLQTLNLSNSNIESIPDSIGKLHNLSVLNLGHCLYLSSLPSSIGQLKSLSELDLSRSQIKLLPDSICDLSNLHTLGLRECFFMHELPQNLSDMKGLVHLNIHGCVELTSMPKWIGKLVQLRTMPIFIHGEEESCSLAELGGLKLEGELQIKNLLKVRRVEEAKSVRLNEKIHIHSLKLSWMKPNSHKNQSEVDESEDFGSVASIQHAEDVLQSLQPSKSLRGLKIEGYVGRTLPFWIMDLSLSNLGHLALAFCNCEELPGLGQLPLLEDLQLTALPLITQLGSDFYGGSNAFPSLRELELKDMAGLEKWLKVGEELFLPCLKSLTLQGCPKLKELPSDFPSVTTLKMNVDDELLLSYLQRGAFPNLKQMNMQNYEGEGPIARVLEERAEALSSWSLGSKPRPMDGDSRATSSFGFGMAELVLGPGENTVEFPLF